MNLFHGCPANAEKVALDSAATFASQSLQMDSKLQNPRSLSASVPSTGSTVDAVETEALELLEWFDGLLPRGYISTPTLSLDVLLVEEFRDRRQHLRAAIIRRTLAEAFE